MRGPKTAAAPKEQCQAKGTGLPGRNRDAENAEDWPLQQQDAGLPDTHRRDPHKPGECPALRGREEGHDVSCPYKSDGGKNGWPRKASPTKPCYGVMAMTRRGLPEPLTILSGAAMTTAPVGGNWSRLHRLARPNFPLPCITK